MPGAFRVRDTRTGRRLSAKSSSSSATSRTSSSGLASRASPAFPCRFPLRFAGWSRRSCAFRFSPAGFAGAGAAAAGSAGSPGTTGAVTAASAPAPASGPRGTGPGVPGAGPAVITLPRRRPLSCLREGPPPALLPGLRRARGGSRRGAYRRGPRVVHPQARRRARRSGGAAGPEVCEPVVGGGEVATGVPGSPRGAAKAADSWGRAPGMESYHDAVDTLSCSSGGRSEDVLDQLLERYTLDVRPKWCAKLRKRCGSLDVSVDYLLGEPARLQGLSVAVKSFGAYKKLRWWDKVQWDVGNGDARLYTKKIPMGILRLQVSARPRGPLPRPLASAPSRPAALLPPGFGRALPGAGRPHLTQPAPLSRRSRGWTWRAGERD